MTMKLNRSHFPLSLWAGIVSPHSLQGCSPARWEDLHNAQAFSTRPVLIQRDPNGLFFLLIVFVDFRWEVWSVTEGCFIVDMWKKTASRPVWILVFDFSSAFKAIHRRENYKLNMGMSLLQHIFYRMEVIEPHGHMPFGLTFWGQDFDHPGSSQVFILFIGGLSEVDLLSFGSLSGCRTYVCFSLKSETDQEVFQVIEELSTHRISLSTTVMCDCWHEFHPVKCCFHLFTFILSEKRPSKELTFSLVSSKVFEITKMFSDKTETILHSLFTHLRNSFFSSSVQSILMLKSWTS